MKTNTFEKRRSKLLKRISKGKGNKIAVIQNNSEVIRNGHDAHFPFRSDSNFWYLTGFDEPGAVLVLVADKKPRSILFCKENQDATATAFNGAVTGTKGAIENFGFDEAYPIYQLESTLSKMLADMDTLYYFIEQKPDFDTRVMRWVSKAKASGSRRAHAPVSAILDLEPLVSEMRIIKDKEEIELMKKASDATAKGAREAMTSCVPGMMEYEMEADILHSFRYSGCGRMPAFTSIVANGGNATTLHYDKNDCALCDGDLVLIDIGAEYKNYSGDVSRTFPVNGKFTVAQKEIYEIVLSAQKAGIEKVRAGNSHKDAHHVCVRIITEGLVKLGLLHGDVDEVIALGDDRVRALTESYKRFFMHGTGHFLGLDTHDVGAYANDDDTSRTLEVGMVVTVEPGIYIKPAPDVPEKYWNIGIRIEDDVVVTKNGPEILSHFAPKEIEEIEALMKK